MSVGAKTALFTAYVLSSVIGLAILKRYLVQVSLPVRGAPAPAAQVIGYLSLGASLYIASFGLWLIILRSMPLVTAYPTAIGLSILGTTLVSLVFLRETIGIDQAAGILLILLGACLTLRGS